MSLDRVKGWCPGAPRRGWCPGALRPMATGDGLLVRVRVTGGVLAPGLAAALAAMARRHGNGLIDLTSRANLQLRGVREATLAPLQAELAAAGLLDLDAASEAVRNVMASPLAGLDPGCHRAIEGLAPALEEALVAAADLHALPAKFGFLLDGGGAMPLSGVEADVRFVAAGDRFAVEAGGQALGFVAAQDVVATALSLARAFLRLRRGEERRMRDVAHRVVGWSVVGWSTEPPPPPSAHAEQTSPLSSRPDSSLGCHPRRGRRPREGDPGAECAAPGSPSLASLAGDDGVAISPGTTGWCASASLAGDDEVAISPGTTGWCASASLAGDDGWCAAYAPFGRLTADQLDGLARLARADGGGLRLTPWRAILLAPCRDTVAADIAGLGLVVDPADPRLAVAACPGSAGCASGEADVQKDAVAFALALAPRLDHTVSIHVSGCAKGCARRLPATLMLVAEGGRYGLAFGAGAGDPRETPLMTADEMTTHLRGLPASRLHEKSPQNV